MPPLVQEEGKKGNKRAGKKRLRISGLALIVVGSFIANGIILSVGRGFLGFIGAELLWNHPGHGTLEKEKKKKKSVAISKVRLVQQSFCFDLVLVTHHDVRGRKSLVFCLFAHRSHFSVSIVVVV